MLEIIAVYFIANLILAILLWLYAMPKGISPTGFFLMMILFGLILIFVLLVLLLFAVLAGASYNLGEIVEKFFKGVIP
jgi:hypothetical protein